MKRTPSSTDRIIDAASLLMVVVGVGLFAFARYALTGIANGSRTAPEGMSAVAVTDLHVLQSTMGLWITGLGLFVGLVAFVRHRVGARDKAAI